jgi:hypothetical protein
VRILAEGQFDVDGNLSDELNRLDTQLEEAVDAGDETMFRTALSELLDKVRKSGNPLPEDSLEPSDAVLPPADAALEEVRAMLSESDEGLIPG